MRVFGITGGSGSGKTTVSQMLAALGVEIIDTDKIAREVTKAGSDCLKELSDAFGSEIILPDGSLDRKKLASVAFNNKEKTVLLSRITHKYIKSETMRRIAASTADLIGVDGAVIIGSPIEPLCEKIVLVTADRDIRLTRIKARDNLTDTEAKKRLDAQPDEEFYAANSYYIINNSGSAEGLTEQVQALYNKLRGV